MKIAAAVKNNQTLENILQKILPYIQRQFPNYNQLNHTEVRNATGEIIIPDWELVDLVENGDELEIRANEH